MRSLEGNHFWHLKGVQTWMHRDNRQDWVEPFTTEVMCRGRGRPPGPAWSGIEDQVALGGSFPGRRFLFSPQRTETALPLTGAAQL